MPATPIQSPSQAPLPQTPEVLAATVRALQSRVAELEQQLAWFMDQYRLGQYRRFASARERSPYQLDLFSALLADAEAATLVHEETVSTTEPLTQDSGAPASSDRTQRRRGQRSTLPPSLPRETMTHDLPADDKPCRCCGQLRTVIGEQRSEQLDIIPPRLKVIEHRRLTYACQHCDSGGVNTAAKPPAPIPKSNASPGLLAYVVTAKVVDGLPLYRQERVFERLGFKLPRNTQAAWLIKAGQLVQPVVNLLHDALLGREIILADETTLQVLNEPGRAAQTTSYLWCYRSGQGPPIVLFDYSETRAGQHPKAFLAEFDGYLLTDGYIGYDQVRSALSRPTQVGCWAHARRYFHDVVKARARNAVPGLADEALAHVDALFRLERGWRDHDARQRYHLRQQFSAPIVKQFSGWLDRYAGAVAPKTLLGKAIGYTLRAWARLTRFLHDGRLPLSNNATERAIKYVVIGRKNFLFAYSPAGARALANLYGLVQTASENGWEPWTYLKHLFTALPQALSVEQVEALLPWRACETPV